MPSEDRPVPNPAAAASVPTTRLKCAACGVEVRAVGWREGMAAKCKKCGGAMRPVSTSPGSDATLRTIPLDPLIGQALGGCRISRKIGSGGMGAVYEGKHLGLDKTVAIKILPPEFSSHATAIERFQREARAAAKLEHANIVQVLNVGQEHGFNFIIMQFVEGESLGKLVSRRKALPWREALKYVRDAARGLASAHAAGVVHRDIKPDNILVAKDGVAKVADFGLARTLDSGVSLSTTGQIMGTPDYMSPEQAQATGADGRSDIYSLGATFFFLLTARKPFQADTPLSIIMKHVSEPLRPVRELNADVPEAVQNVVAKMMAKKADDRFADCPSLIAALDELERGGAPVSANELPVSDAPAVLPAASGARGLLFAGIGIGAVLVFAAIVMAMVKSRHDGGTPKPVATVKDPVVPPADPVPPTTEKEVLALYKSLDDAISSRSWDTARKSLAALLKLSTTPAYAPLEKNIAELTDRIRAHDQHVASGMLKDLPGGAERWTFEFERKEEEEGIDSHQWISSRFLTEKGVLAGIGLLSPRTDPDQLDGVLRARFQFIERARKFKLGRTRPGDDGAHPQAGFGFRVQEGVEAWGAGLEDLDGDQVKAIIGHVTQFKPKVEIDAVKSLEVALPGDEMFDLWVSFHGNHLVLGIGDKEVLAVDDGRLTKPGNLFFYSLGAGVKLDRVVFERSK